MAGERSLDQLMQFIRTAADGAVLICDSTLASKGVLFRALAAGDIPAAAVPAAAQIQYAGTTGGTSTAYTLTPTNALTLVAGARVAGRIHATNGATPTLAVSGLAAKGIYKYTANGNAAIGTGQLLQDEVYTFQYDAVLDKWVVISQLRVLEVDLPNNLQSNVWDKFITAGGTGDAITATISPARTLVAGDRVSFVATAANTGAVTLALTGATPATAVAVQKGAGTALAANDIDSGAVITAVYSGTVWLLPNYGLA